MLGVELPHVALLGHALFDPRHERVRRRTTIGVPKRPARSVGRDRGEVRQQPDEVAGGEVAIGVLGARLAERAPVVARRGDRLLDEHVDAGGEQLGAPAARGSTAAC